MTIELAKSSTVIETLPKFAWGQLFNICLTLPLVLLWINKFLATEHQKLSNLQNSFEDRRVQFPASYWSMYFSDLHIILLKSDSQLLAAFQKSFVKIQEIN
jgi:hypothetical protein